MMSRTLLTLMNLVLLLQLTGLLRELLLQSRTKVSVDLVGLLLLLVPLREPCKFILANFKDSLSNSLLTVIPRPKVDVRAV
jgi:hypothetical protein